MVPFPEVESAAGKVLVGDGDAVCNVGDPTGDLTVERDEIIGVMPVYTEEAS